MATPNIDVTATQMIATVDADLSAVDLPTYSEALDALREACKEIRALVRMGKTCVPGQPGLRTAMNFLNRVDNRREAA